MVNLHCDFRDILGEPVQGHATITSGSVRPSPRGQKVVVPEQVTKDVVGGVVVFNNVIPGDVVVRVVWDRESATIRCVVPDKPTAHLSELILAKKYDSTEIEVIRGYFNTVQDIYDQTKSAANTLTNGIEKAKQLVETITRDKGDIETWANNVHRDHDRVWNLVGDVNHIKTRIEAVYEQLGPWMEKYEWLKANLPTKFQQGVDAVNQAVQNATQQARTAAETASRDSQAAGVHKTAAQAAERGARAAAQQAVTQAINELKGNAPQIFDTLGEIAERIKAGGSLEREILAKISEKVPQADFAALRDKVNNLAISNISGLAAALADKASRKHTHYSEDIYDATPYATANKVIKRDSHGKAEIEEPLTAKEIANKGYVDGLMGGLKIARGTGLDPDTIYFEV